MNENSENNPTETGSDNSAWAGLNTTLTTHDLLEFCTDIERLFRINPYLEFSSWEQTSPQNASISITNISNDEPFSLDSDISISKLDDGFRIEYSDGIKSSTRFKVEPSDTGALLKIIDEYHDIDETNEAAIKQVDKSIVAWAKDLQEYIFKWQRWKWLAPWRWYMRGPWQRMKPPARRITYMLFWITFAELMGFILIFVIFWYDFDEFFKL